MLDLVRIVAVFALVVFLLKLKWNLGAVMLLGAAALGLSKGMPPSGILGVAFRASVERQALSLLAALALIMVLENVLRKTETLRKLVESVQGVVGDRRVVMALMPAIIGVLPSAGGAFFSAPMVEASSGGPHVRPERKSFINYWFRHIWEYVSPLYPGFILTASIAGVHMGRLFLYQAAFPVTVLAAGALYGFREVEAGPAPAGGRGVKDLGAVFASFSPILAVMLLVMALKVDIAAALAFVVAGLFAYFRFGPARIAATLRESLSVNTLLLVLGVQVFGGVMKASGVVDGLPQFFRSEGIPVAAILFLLPFLVGLITGITLAFVGVTFPMILPLIGGADPSLPMLAFAFASGFAGVMFSPVHLCLVLTKDYFKSELLPIFRIMLIPEGLVLAVAAAQMLIL